jgi:serine/threonine protein kinase
MLQNEIEAMKTLHHENILKCYDVLTTAKNCYIVVEFCEGGDLAGVLQAKGKMSEVEAIGWIRGVLMGFLEMVDNGYLHRDLKPANILIKKGVAKLADFGFCKKYSMYKPNRSALNPTF